MHPRLPAVVEGTARPLWVPVSAVGGTGQTVYVGSVVTWFAASGDGVLPTAAATAAPMKKPIGIVLGTNGMPGAAASGFNQYNSTYMTDYITQVITQAAVNGRDWRMVEGMWIKSEPGAMVQIAYLNINSVVRLPIYAHGTNLTAPSVLTSTTGSATGLTVTTNAADYTPIAYESTLFCRTGLNRGLYRTTYNTNTTAWAWYIPMPYTTATAGETYVSVDFALGRTHIDMQTTGLGINTVTSLATNYYDVEVLEIHLEDPNDEYAIVRFV